MTVLGVDMKGKALLFKTVGMQENENHSDFHRMPVNLECAALPWKAVNPRATAIPFHNSVNHG